MSPCLCILALAAAPFVDGARSQHFVLPDEQGEPLAVVTHKRTGDVSKRVFESALVWRAGALVTLQTESVDGQGLKFVHRELPLAGLGGRTWLAEAHAGEKVLRFESHCWGAPSPREMHLEGTPIGAGGLTAILAAGGRPLETVWLLDPGSASVQGIVLSIFDPAEDPLLLSAASGAIRAAGLRLDSGMLTGFEWRTLEGRLLRRQVFCAGELVLFQLQGRQAWARRVSPRLAMSLKRRWTQARGSGWSSHLSGGPGS